MTPSEPQPDFDENSSPTVLDPPQTKRRWILPVLIMLSTVGTGFAAWRFFVPGNQSTQINTATTATKQQEPGISVKLLTLEPSIVQETSEFVASLESRRSETMRSQIQGQVTQILVKSGDTVKQGASLAQIDFRQPQAVIPNLNPSLNPITLAAQSQLEIDRSTLRTLESDRITQQTELKSSQQEFDRYNTLASQGAIPRQTKDQYAIRLATAKTNLNATESKIQAQKAAITKAERAIQQPQPNTQKPSIKPQNYRIVAPFAGTIGEIPVKVGDVVNTSTQLFTITQNNPLDVHVFVPIEQAPKLQNGMLVEIMDIQGRIIGTSRVFSISPKLANNTQSVLVKALYDNSKNQLKADQFLRARLIWKQRPGVSVPATAISRVGGQTFVYVAETQTSGVSSQLVAKHKPIKLGHIKGSNYQVLEGLKPGEQIITSGLINLREGDRVLPE
ncbi:efflux RND transporter periplasmic adaptor subunit [Brunnivagina elsteri]|uniref:Efflux transporter periplasmic adaptor subunit n=1 Tax=Brunnivagina elsteri CCALA 953 TaxID=987040 RepID=A0A2A2TF32_9CYAN|nr:efflux RND transporter periplasmic adaptor subunit [Calothrix elsteri]PAX52301.1 efflux transporter periplasmic adaptor subunit [Calothrix elsteri CCALA 953]